MKKRAIDNLEEQLLSQIDVSESVLDKAHDKLLAEKNKEEKEKVSRSFKFPVRAYSSGQGGTDAGVRVIPQRKILISVIACLLAIAVVLTVIFILPKNELREEPKYKLDELDKRNIGSISLYNQENGTDYICASDLQTESYAYSNEIYDVLLSETFNFKESRCIWYVLTNNIDWRVDILAPFDDCSETLSLMNYDVFYILDDNAIKSYFIYESQGYYLQLYDGDYDLMIEVLSYLFQ